MNQLTLEGFMFYMFWGSALLVGACVVLWFFERND